jgi:hypothetical protein
MMRHRKLFGAVAPFVLLLCGLIGPRNALAGCGCNKPPPKPAAVIPNVAFSGMSVTLYDKKFHAGQEWNVTFISGTTKKTVVGKVVRKRDITDTTGKTRTPQLIAVVPKLPPGPTSVEVRHARSRSVLFIPADSFVVMGMPVVVSQQSAELELPTFTTAVGQDNTLYVAVGGLNHVCAAMQFTSQLDGYPIRFGDGDVLVFNWQGYFIDSLTPASKNHFQIQPGDPNSSDQLIYSRHSFELYCAQHRPGGSKQIDPRDPNWHLDGTPHVDYAIVIFAINGHFDTGASMQPGLVTSQMKMETSLGDGTGEWEPEQPEEGN